MFIKNTKKWEPTKTQLDDVILPGYSDISKKCVFYIRKLECSPQYIAYMLRDIADAIINSYPEDKGKSSNFRSFNE